MAPTATAHRERGVDPAEPFFSAAVPFLDRLALFFEEQKEEFEPELSGLVDYALSHSGKRLRPIALFLTGSGPEGEFTEEMVRAAAVVELVHLATLVHDDILDGADVRHEHETVSRRHGVSAAVLLGDALFAQSLQLASRFPTTEVCRQVSEATRKICAGEIEQTLDGGNDGDGIERYFRIIERKTAVLFQVSCRLGALLGRPGPEFSDAAGEFGRRLGIAYQIYDDLVDVIGSESVIGKTLGTDFASGKETLPFLLLRESADREGEPFPVDGLREDAFADGSDPRKLVFERGVVPRVADYFHREIAGALRAVDEFDGFGNVDRLRQIAGFVERRFRRLLELHAE